MEDRKPKKLHRKLKICLAVVLIAAVFVGIYLGLQYQTYGNVRIIKTHEEGSSDNANYVQCMDGVLRYSRDGVALLTDDGKEAWNQACQMNNPIVEMCGDTAVVGDKGGTSVYVFEKKGLKGEIQTTRPIEKLTVSAQGIVAAILKDEKTPLVMCYDAKGNILVEHTTSLKNTGYPVDVALSKDGNVLLVSYLFAKGNIVSSRIVYYHFGETGAGKEGHQVYQKEYEGVIVPTTAFLDADTSMLVADDAIVLYEGLEEPKESARIEMSDEILSVAYNEKLIAVVLRDAGQTGQKLYVYNTKGEELSATEIEREYTRIKVAGKQIILYDGTFCSIVTKNGIYKYEGELETNIVEIYPVSGLNKYVVISTNGFQTVQLVK